MREITKEQYQEMIEMEKDARRLGIPLFRFIYLGYKDYLIKSNIQHSDDTLKTYYNKLMAKQL